MVIRVSISFVIPAYNEEKNIGVLIESIRRDMFHLSMPYEIIVVDNNSTDTTAAVAMSFGADVVVNEPHQGIVWARQCGFKLAKYSFIAFIDADARVPLGWTQ